MTDTLLAGTRAEHSPPCLLARPGAVYAAGRCRFVDASLADIARDHGDGAAWLAAFERHGADAPRHVTGDFAVAVHTRSGRVHLAVDRFAVRTLCWRQARDGVLCHERADVVAGADAGHDPQALYNYLYFHTIPAPRTFFADVARVPAGHCVTIEHRDVVITRWWQPRFVEDGSVAFADLRREFRALVRGAVARELEGPGPVGCFLSGGTDSSTVAGMLCDITGKPAPTYSIGFDADGYDEMAFARIAARHFGTDHHELYVTPADLVDSIPRIAAACDQPFGNSSIVPTYFCAKVARADGMARILGGDGGDELFGGNSRYAKQRVFGWYDTLPGVARTHLVEPLFAGRSGSGVPGFSKFASYVEQARVPMPDRTQMYNLLSRLGVDEVLAAPLLAQVDTEEPLRDLRAAWRAVPAPSLVNRMLAHDWRYTLAENDLPKVRNAAAIADIPVGFPLLDDALADFSLRLPPQQKLKGLQLRWFFKEALRGFLPDATLRKQKHGFGLPFGVWVNRHADLHALAADAVHGLARRGVVREAFVARLLREHLPRHPGYYGELVWIFMMLELWLRRPGTALPAVAADAVPRAAHFAMERS